MIRAGQLKHQGEIKEATAHDATGQPTGWTTIFPIRFGVNDQAIVAADESNNLSAKKTLSLFARYDQRLQDQLVLFAFGQRFIVSQIENVAYANRRLNFIAIEQ
tara:strand:+ start:23860 stop:24171 length:312 start_codon:yes stop_codon:yes gene_type:complete